MSISSKFIVLLDSKFLSRLGNFGVAIRLAVFVALLITGIVVGVVHAVAQIATVWIVLIAVALFGLLLEALAWLFPRLAGRRVTHASDEGLIYEATALASDVSVVLADHKRDEPDPFAPAAKPTSHKAWAKRVNESRKAENRALARYLERHQAQVFAVANELGTRGALSEDEVSSVVHAGRAIDWMDKVPGLLLLGARKLRDKG